MRTFDVRRRLTVPGIGLRLVGDIYGEIECGDRVVASDDDMVYEVIAIERKAGLVIAINVRPA